MSIQGETLLEVKNMFKSFGPTIALKDVNLTIKEAKSMVWSAKTEVVRAP